MIVQPSPRPQLISQRPLIQSSDVESMDVTNLAFGFLIGIQMKLAHFVISHFVQSMYLFPELVFFATHFRTSHRFPELHKCSSIIEKKSDNMTIKNVSSSVRNSSLATPRKHKPPRDPAKLAQWQKVELMKMRHRAVPGDPKDRNTSILPDQRHHVKVVIDNAEKIFWFRKVGSHDK